ncbi:MAG: acyltransferase domain-containing protein, partial [Mycobacterium sp.]
MTAHGQVPDGLPDGRIPVLLTAHEGSLIAQDAAAILRYLKLSPSVDSVSSTLLHTRRIRRCRAVVRAADQDELFSGLRALEAAVEHPRVTHSERDSAPRTAFVFPGQGNHWPGMGSEAYHRLGAYRVEANSCEDAFTAAGSRSPVAYLTGDGEGWTQAQTQAAQFTHAVALARVWQSLGVHPQMTIGHSLGEIAAAYVAGAVRLSDAVGVVTARAAVVEGIAGRYGMAIVGVSAGTVAALAARTPGWLEVAVINSPSSTVIAGEVDGVASVVRRLTDG